VGASPNTAVFATGARNNKIKFLHSSAPQGIKPMFHFYTYKMETGTVFRLLYALVQNFTTYRDGAFYVLQSPRNFSVNRVCRYPDWSRLAYELTSKTRY
jgi:hypothetical protein